jgi:hypothetical protein
MISGDAWEEASGHDRAGRAGGARGRPGSPDFGRLPSSRTGSPECRGTQHRCEAGWECHPDGQDERPGNVPLTPHQRFRHGGR